MNRPEKKDLVACRMAKANETIAEIDILVQNKLWNIAVNRLYYACFYAVSALLVQNEIYSKTHAGIRQMFGKHFLATGKVRLITGDYYSKIFMSRHRGDEWEYTGSEPEGRFKGKALLKYDAHGNLTEQDLYSYNGAFAGKIICKYDGDKNLMQVTEQDKSDKAYRAFTIKYKYDAHNNWITKEESGKRVKSKTERKINYY